MKRVAAYSIINTREPEEQITAPKVKGEEEAQVRRWLEQQQGVIAQRWLTGRYKESRLRWRCMESKWLGR